LLEKTINQLFDMLVLHHGPKTAFCDQDRTITYTELDKEVTKLAAVLQSNGVMMGSRVGLYMENRIEFVVAEFALAKLGAIRVPMNTYLNEDEVFYRIVDSNSNLFLYQSSLVTKEFIKSVKHQCHMLDVDTINYDMKEVNTGSLVLPTVNSSDPVTIMYTGGTTGRSKGVLHTHKTIVAIVYSETYELDIERGAVLLHTTPLPHSAGYFVMPGMLRGAKQIIEKRFNSKRFCDLVEQHKVTFAFLVPTMIYMLLEEETRKYRDLSSLRTMVYGAAPMAPSRVKEAIEVFGPILIQIYSQAEVINQTTVLTKDDHISALKGSPDLLASCGRSIIMSHVRIVDGRGADVAIGEVGELITSGPHQMIAYWNKADETEKTIKEGWIYTGDMAYQDSDGYYYLVDRKNDMIISGGFNVYTTSVEKVLFEHDRIQQATVIGIPDEKWGETIKAFVVSQDKNMTELEVIRYCKTKLAKYEVPKSVEFCTELPLTPYGKIDKKSLRNRYWREGERQVN